MNYSFVHLVFIQHISHQILWSHLSEFLLAILRFSGWKNKKKYLTVPPLFSTIENTKVLKTMKVLNCYNNWDWKYLVRTYHTEVIYDNTTHSTSIAATTTQYRSINCKSRRKQVVRSAIKSREHWQTKSTKNLRSAVRAATSGFPLAPGSRPESRWSFHGDVLPAAGIPR